MIRHLEINLNGLCNLKCSYCPRANGYPNTNVHMSDETVELLCQQVAEYPHEIVLHFSGRGEPTLHKKFTSIMKRIRKVPNIHMHLVTNGARVKRHVNAMKLFDTIIWNVYSDDHDDFFEAIEFAKANGFDKQTRFDLKPDNMMVGAQTYNRQRSGKFELYHHKLTNRAGKVDPQTIPEISQKASSKWCDRMFDKPSLNWNGDIILCCEDWTDVAISNIHKETLMHYDLHNPTINNLRKDMDKGIRHGICKTCSYPYEQ